MTKDIADALGSGAEALKQLGAIAEMLLKPMATRAQASADADALLMVANAEAQAAHIRTEARRRADLDEIRHYTNIAAALKDAKVVIEDKAARNLLPEHAGKGESDPDWFHKWASYAKETSDHDIRALWAKVLAGEIIQPGRFSLRLLHTLNLLRKAEARDFELFSNFVWIDTDGSMLQPYSLQSESYLRIQYQIHQSFYSRLSNLGLITDFGRELLTDWRIRRSARLTYNNRSYSFELVNVFENREPVKVRDVTPLGAELFELCQPKPDAVYAERVTQGVRERGLLGGWDVKETQLSEP